MSGETTTMRMIQLALSKARCRLWRNNIGVATHGVVKVVYGLATGSGDLIGFTEVTITPEMVGKSIAVFTSIEVKTAKKYATAPQRAWAAMVRCHGGFAGTARSVDDAVRILNGEKL